MLLRFCLGPDRQTHKERRALAEYGLHPDAAAVQLHDALCDRQPQSCASFALGESGVALLELLEYLLLILLLDPRAAVGDTYQKRTIGGADAYCDLAFLGELDGVAD